MDNLDIVHTICCCLDLKSLLNLEEVNKDYKTLIRKNLWPQLIVMINSFKALNLCLKTHMFDKFDLSYINVTDKSISKLVNCHTLNLWNTNVTDESVSKLVNCHTLSLGYTRITDKSVSKLINCHTLDLSHTMVTDESVSKLINCHTLKLWCTNVTDESVLKLVNCHTLYLGWTDVTKECKDYLKSKGVKIEK